MPKMKGYFDEDVLLLYPDNHSEKFNRFPQLHCEAPIIKGAVSQLRRWPSDLFLAFLAACVVIGGLIFLIFVTVAFCLPTAIDNRCRVIESLEIEDSPNVYFLKLENRTWSTREFCYIETAARKHPDLNVYLINLSKDEPVEQTVDEKTENKTKPVANTNDTSKLTPEEQLKNYLVLGNANIRTIDVSIERFFKSSKLSRIAKGLSDETLEMAAKAQLLWNSPGIVMNPNMYCNLKSMETFLCNRKKESCLPDNLATIEPKHNIQATAVPCQAFMGFIMHAISKNKLDERYTLKEAVEEYCPRLYYCPEIRLLDLKPTCPVDELNCPIVYSSIILENYLNL